MIGAAGYYAMGEQTPQVIIERKSIEGTDYFMLASRAVFPLNLAICIPLHGGTLRQHIAEMLGKDDPENKKPTSLLFHVFWSIVILSFSAALAYLFPQIINVISIIGGFACTSTMITFPGSFTTSQDLTYPRNYLYQSLQTTETEEYYNTGFYTFIHTGWIYGSVAQSFGYG